MIPKLSGAILALCAFSGMLVAGLMAGNPYVTILSRALWGLLGGLCVGFLLGYIAQLIVHEQFGNKVARDVESELSEDDWGVGTDTSGEPDGGSETNSSENPSGEGGQNKESGENNREFEKTSPDTTFAARAAKAVLEEG